jgi:hypothetical protein
LIQEQRALRGWISGFKVAQEQFIKSERLRLKVAGKNRKAQQKALQPYLDQLKDLNWLTTQYRAERQKHWDHWQEDRERAIQTEALRLNQIYQFAGQLGASDHTKAKNALVIQRQPRNTGRLHHQ